MTEKDDDIWSRWSRRNWWPFTRSWGFEDVEDLFSGMEDFMANRFK